MAMENKNQILIIILAIVAGLIAAATASKYVQTKITEQTTALSQEYEAKQKEMAAQLQQQTIAQVEALKQKMDADKAEAEAAMQQKLAAVQAQMQAQAAVAKEAKPEKVRKPSLALRTPAGKRAVTVQIASLNAVGGLLNAGDVVDVIAHLSVPDRGTKENPETVTAMIFQNLQVLAINTNLDDPGAYDDQQTAATLKVTVAVDPQESGLLAFANKNGKLELALRSPDEKDKQMVKASTWKTLADYVLQNEGSNILNPDDDNTKKDTTKPVEKPTIQIFRGGKEL